MSLVIRYCESCGERVPDEDLRSGAAIQLANASYCASCKDAVAAGLGSEDALVALQTPVPDASPHKKARRAAPELSSLGGRGGTTRRRRASGRAAPPSAPAQQDQRQLQRSRVAVLIGVIVVALTGGALMMRGGPTPSVDDGGGATQPPRPPGRGPAPGGPDAPDDAPLGRRLAELEAGEKAFPKALREHLEQWTEFEREAGDSRRYRPLAAAGRKRVAAALEQAASTRFAQIKRAVGVLLEQGLQAQARTAWEAFDPQLLTPAWRQRVAAEVARIGQTAGALAQAKIQTLTREVAGWRLVPKAEGLSGWIVRSGLWTTPEDGIRAEGFEMPVKGGATQPVGAFGVYLPIDASGRIGALRDYAARVEFRVRTGSARILPRVDPRSVEMATVEHGIPLPPAGEALDPERWYTLHLIANGQRGWYWIDDLLPPQALEPIGGPEAGGLGLLCAEGARLDLRGLSIRQRQTGATIGRRFRPFDGPELWTGWGHREGHEAWRRDGRVVHAQAPPKVNTLVYFGEPDWQDMQLSFEFRGLQGQLCHYMRWKGRRPNYWVFCYATDSIPDPQKWYRVTTCAIGPIVSHALPPRLLRPLPGCPVLPRKYADGAGPVGFRLGNGMRCQFRAMEVIHLPRSSGE